MAKTSDKPTIEQIRNAYVAFLQITRKQQPEVFAETSERILYMFIRKFIDTNFDGILNLLDHNFYDRIRGRTPTGRRRQSFRGGRRRTAFRRWAGIPWGR